MKYKHEVGIYKPFVLGAVLVVGILGVVKIVRGQPPGGGLPIPGQVEFDTAQASDLVTTTSTTFVDMPDMSMSFSSSVSDPAIVMFTTEVPFIPGGSPCGALVRLLMDGSVSSNEIPVFDGDATTRGFNFVTQTLSSGTHTAKVEWRAHPDFFNACLQNRTMIILHK